MQSNIVGSKQSVSKLKREEEIYYVASSKGISSGRTDPQSAARGLEDLSCDIISPLLPGVKLHRTRRYPLLFRKVPRLA